MVFAFTILLFVNCKGSDQTGELRVSLVAESATVPEHLPAAFDVVVKNESSRKIELYPYDLNRLPETVPDIKFESALLAAPASPKVNDFGFTPVTLGPFETLRIKDYLQHYMQHLAPGAYTIPYSLHWEYKVEDAASSSKQATAKGSLQFNVTPGDPTALNQYISARTKIIQEGVELRASRAAAEEISLIDTPAVVSALLVLKDNGYEFEALHAGERLPAAEAVKVLTAIAGSSRNPAIVREAIGEIEKRGSGLPDETVRTLLGSSNKWLQIQGLDYIARSARPQLASEVSKLMNAQDPEVRQAAERAMNNLRNSSK